MLRTQALKLFLVVGICALICGGFTRAFGQSPARVPKTIFIDSKGDLISNNEFVDLRLANPSGKDIATQTVLEDGTTEFRLGAVPQEGTACTAVRGAGLGRAAVNTEDFKGKVVVLNFWFIGCPGCISEMPKLNELRQNIARMRISNSSRCTEYRPGASGLFRPRAF